MRLIILCAFISTQLSCSKVDESSIEAVIGSNELYTLDLATAIPVEGGFRIIEEPSNAIRSELDWDPADGVFKYFYQSEIGFIGQERIVIQLATSPGDDNFTFSNLVINLDVQ